MTASVPGPRDSYCHGDGASRTDTFGSASPPQGRGPRPRPPSCPPLPSAEEHRRENHPWGDGRDENSPALLRLTVRQPDEMDAVHAGRRRRHGQLVPTGESTSMRGVISWKSVLFAGLVSLGLMPAAAQAGSGPSYCWDEARNPGGANRCTNNQQCDGARTCSAAGRATRAARTAAPAASSATGRARAAPRAGARAQPATPAVDAPVGVLTPPPSRPLPTTEHAAVRGPDPGSPRGSRSFDPRSARWCRPMDSQLSPGLRSRPSHSDGAL